MIKLRFLAFLATIAGLNPGQLQSQNSPQGGDPEGALPLELAFDMRTLLLDASPLLSPDGLWVAYVVRERPKDTRVDNRFMTNGVPGLVVGSRIIVTHREDGRRIDVCPPSGSCWRPSWAPDSRGLVMYSDGGGYPQLWMYDLSVGEARLVSESRTKPKLWWGDRARWSPDGRRVFVHLSPDQRAEGDFSSFSAAQERDQAPGGPNAAPLVTVLRNSRNAEDTTSTSADRSLIDHMMFENNATLAAIDVASGEMEVLVDAETTPRPSVLRLSPSGRWLSYLSVFNPESYTSSANTYDLGVVPVDGGDVRVLAEGLPVGSDWGGQGTYRWHPSEDRLVYLSEEQLWLIDFDEGGPKPPRRLGGGLGPLSEEPLGFALRGDAVVVGARPEDPGNSVVRGTRGLAWVPLDGAPIARVSFGSAWEYQDMVWATDRMLWQRRERVVNSLLKNASTGESAIVQVDFSSGEEGAIDVRWSGLARFRGFQATDDDEVVAFFEDLTTPESVVSLNADFSELRHLAVIDERLAEVARSTAEVFEVEVPLHDGSLGTVRTAVVLPHGAKRGDRLPAVVMHYPGSDLTRYVERFGGGSPVTVPTLAFVSRGYAVILANVPLGPSAEPGNPMQEIVDPLLPQIYRAAELGYVDLTRVGVTGQSYGGYGTGAIISRTNLFSAAVGISGIYDFGGTYGHMAGGSRPIWSNWLEGGRARMGTHPWADVRRYLDNSPYYQADKIRTPLLLVHGDEDATFYDAEKLFSALRRLDREVELAVYHGQGHVIRNWNQAHAIDATRRMLDFFDRHLGRVPPEE